MSELLELFGELHLNSTDEGGRKDCIFSGYRPTFDINGHLFSGMIYLENGVRAYPGNTRYALVYFSPDKIDKAGDISIGQQLFFSEGSSVLGDFTIKRSNGVVTYSPNDVKRWY